MLKSVNSRLRIRGFRRLIDAQKKYFHFVCRIEETENFALCTVNPLITNTSEEFIKCRLDNFSMSFILYYVNLSICENK